MAAVWRGMLFLGACVSAGRCLYEDEIGRTDWYVLNRLEGLHPLVAILHLVHTSKQFHYAEVVGLGLQVCSASDRSPV